MPSFNEKIPADPNSDYFSLQGEGDSAIVKFEDSWEPVQTRFGERNRVTITPIDDDILGLKQQSWDVGRKTLLTVQKALTANNCSEWCFRVTRSGLGPETKYSIVPVKLLSELSPF